MQTIPDVVLDLIIQQRPDLGQLASELRQNPQAAAAIEQRIAAESFKGTPLVVNHEAQGLFSQGLQASMIRDLAACAMGDPYGAQRNQTWIDLHDARETWVNVALAVHLSGYDRTHLYRLARSGRLTVEQRNNEMWLKRAEVQALERDPAGRPDVAREARRARLPKFRDLFPTNVERVALVNAVAGVGHRQEFIQDLPEQLRIGLMGSSYVQYDNLDLEALLRKVRLLEEADRETLVRALEYTWSRINKPEGVPYPEGLFTDCL